MESDRQGSDLASDERYHALVRRRSRFAWGLSAVMLAIFFGYILLIAFRRDILAMPIGGGVTSLGIPVGIGVILAGIALTGVYVRKANREFDPAFDALRREYGL
ncbi:DUF485 domain-containing protein [Sphingobium sp. CR28]|uniref:DUF485 domain-containing protein n=1 Tax=Sphingobium sp. CR28 TaxID=3400272 RepID=UPI003FEF98DF